MRLFVAIKTDRTLNAALKNVSSSLKLFGNGSFCGDDMYHITLAFIGESDRIADIKAVLDSVSVSPFDISLEGIGNFGSTYYVGVTPAPALCDMQRELCEKLKKQGFDIENRPFKPHITLARRYKANMPPVVFVPQANQMVTKVILFESAGGVYKPLYTKNLNV